MVPTRGPYVHPSFIRPQERPVTGFFDSEDVLVDGKGAVCAFVCLGDGYFVDVVEGCGIFGHLPGFEFFGVLHGVFECFGAEVADKYVVALLNVVGFFKSLLHQWME